MNTTNKSISERLNELEYSNYIDTHFFYGDDFERSYEKLIKHTCSKDVWFAHRCLTEIKSINHKLYFMVDNKKAEALSYLKEPFETCIITYAEVEDLYRQRHYTGLSSQEMNDVREKLQVCHEECKVLLECFLKALKFIYESSIITDYEYKRFYQTIERKMEMVMKETEKRISSLPNDITV